MTKQEQIQNIEKLQEAEQKANFPNGDYWNDLEDIKTKLRTGDYEEKEEGEFSVYSSINY